MFLVCNNAQTGEMPYSSRFFYLLFYFFWICRDTYKENMDPLGGKHKKTMVTENILMREIIW